MVLLCGFTFVCFVITGGISEIRTNKAFLLESNELRDISNLIGNLQIQTISLIQLPEEQEEVK